MTIEGKFRQNAGQQDYTPSSATVSGKVVQLADGRAALVKSGLAASEMGAVYTKGIISFKCATGVTFAAGAPVYWDQSADTCIASPAASDDVYLGTCVVAKTTELEVLVDLNEGFGGAAGTGQRGAWVTRAVVIDHADTAEFELVSAVENPNGLLVVSFHGVLTEVCAGTEDQLGISLYEDGADAAQSVILASDAGADAVGDILIGTRTLAAGATGNVAAIIPAGCGAYAKVSQATTGSAAGAMKVSALVCPLI